MSAAVFYRGPFQTPDPSPAHPDLKHECMLHGRTHAHTHTHSGTHAHTFAHSGTHARTIAE
eukprot:9481614-Pyramimonas_sp.AAC.1